MRTQLGTAAVLLGMIALLGAVSCLSQAESGPGQSGEVEKPATAADGGLPSREVIRLESEFFEYVSGIGAAGIFVTDGRAYLTTMSGLSVYDVSQPGQPQRLGLLPLKLPGFVTVVGNEAYVARGTMQGKDGNLTIVDVTDPRRMRLVGNTALPWGAASVAVKGNYAYLGGFDAGLFVVDVTDKRAPRLVNTIKFPRIHNPLGDKFPFSIMRSFSSKKDREKFPYKMGRTWWLHIENDLIYVSDENTGVHIMDLSDPARPKEVGHFVNDTTWPDAPGLQQGAANDVDVDGNVAYVACDHRGMHVLDVSRKDRPVLIAHYDPWMKYKWNTSPGHMVQVVVQDGIAYLTAGEAGLHVLDVTNPKSPRLLAQYPVRKNVGCSWGLFVDGDRVYVTYGAFDPGAFRLGLKGGWEILKIRREPAH